MPTFLKYILAFLIPMSVIFSIFFLSFMISVSYDRELKPINEILFSNPDDEILTKPISQSINVRRLREIGWVEWDPIGLLEDNEPWEAKSNVDEYDFYLMQVAGKLQLGESKFDVIRYLVEMEREYMGLDEQDDAMKRAARVVELLQNEKQLWN